MILFRLQRRPASITLAGERLAINFQPDVSISPGTQSDFRPVSAPFGVSRQATCCATLPLPLQGGPGHCCAWRQRESSLHGGRAGRASERPAESFLIDGSALESDWAGLGWTGLDWTGLDWTRLGGTERDWTRLGGTERDWRRASVKVRQPARAFRAQEREGGRPAGRPRSWSEVDKPTPGAPPARRQLSNKVQRATKCDRNI